MPSPVNLSRELDRYYTVELGPKPTIGCEPTPAWHPLATPSWYQFPTIEAATRFSQGHIERGRSVVIRFPDGRAWDGKGWVE